MLVASHPKKKILISEIFFFFYVVPFLSLQSTNAILVKLVIELFNGGLFVERFGRKPTARGIERAVTLSLSRRLRRR